MIAQTNDNFRQSVAILAQAMWLKTLMQGLGDKMRYWEAHASFYWRALGYGVSRPSLGALLWAHTRPTPQAGTGACCS